MKVSLCTKCKISPAITPNEIKCPKCGKTANGNTLTETVEKWNKEDYSDAGKPVTVVVKDIDEIKEEVRNEEPVEKPAKKPVKKPIKKKGAK